MAGPVALLDEPDRLRVGLSPIRRRLLERLRQPASATQLASELAMGRQRVNYHLRALEKAKLVDLVEERQRRGCVERILVARAQAFIVDPAVMTAKTGSGGSNSPAPLGRVARGAGQVLRRTPDRHGRRCGARCDADAGAGGEAGHAAADVHDADRHQLRRAGRSRTLHHGGRGIRDARGREIPHARRRPPLSRRHRRTPVTPLRDHWHTQARRRDSP